MAKRTVVALATVLDGVKTSNHQRFPEVKASYKTTYVTVPHEAVLSTNVTAAIFEREAFDAFPQLVLSFTRPTLAYAPPLGSVTPVPSI